MATPEACRRVLRAVLALALIALPWLAGTQSPLGIFLLLLAVAAGGALALWGNGSLPRLSVPMILAAAAVGLSAANSIAPDRTIQALLLLAAVLAAGVSADRLVRDDPTLASAGLAALLGAGIAVAVSGSVSALPGQAGGLYASQLVGPFGYPNAAAGFLVLSLGAGLAWAAGMPPCRQRWGVLALLAMPAAGILLTRSRGAAIACLGGGVVWAALAYPRWRQGRRRWVPLALLAGSALAAATAPRWLPRLAALRSGGILASLDPSLQWRWHILTWTGQMVRDHPWLGVGPGAFPVALLSYQRIPYVSGLNPHNVYLELAAEYGLPAAGLLVLGFAWLLARLVAAATRLPVDAPIRLRLEVCAAALAALALHAAADLLWSVPAIPAGAAIVAGIAAGHLPASRRGRRPDAARRTGWAAVLLLLAGLAWSRYAASGYLDAGRAALAAGDPAVAQRELAWARRLNPLSFAVHEALAHAFLAAGETGAAVNVAGRTLALAPKDPNRHYLAGAALLADGRPDAAADRFLAAVELAPDTQLRYHAGLLDALRQGKRHAELRWRYAQALDRFSPSRVLAPEARCLAPGDRYLLARMARIIALLPRAGAPPGEFEQAAELASRLAVPDDRGICTHEGRSGQRSPESAASSYWRALAAQGGRAALQFIRPDIRQALEESELLLAELNRLPRGRVTGVAALRGGEREASFEYEVALETGDGRFTLRCASSVATLSHEGWFLTLIPRLSRDACPL
jgi:O-antigen ligase